MISNKDRTRSDTLIYNRVREEKGQTTKGWKMKEEGRKKKEGRTYIAFVGWIIVRVRISLLNLLWLLDDK